ncbi:Uncharacterised protein [Mycobacteroides abscessus subsp. bolletii]|nr:Uncharacterised protein [Mycobacteroides abscessus subsp. abscessus]SHX46567.1 Uncharacterised protein [Mycobacteroides abscessus subsp. bolletii]SHT16433.1 Uncharacterised protein [Mycobacteroides abscessus subsp. abscessus]SHT86919.1 Uncharacterised protein [Mycobacteroides abscessus subsp. abscessus]SHU73574.1 Uncharacterised protein [Mycobacteroides abscessus subsp. abscessus]
MKRALASAPWQLLMAIPTDMCTTPSPNRVRGYGGEVGRTIAPEVAGRRHICRIETMAAAKSDLPSKVVMDALDYD